MAKTTPAKKAVKRTPAKKAVKRVAAKKVATVAKKAAKKVAKRTAAKRVVSKVAALRVERMRLRDLAPHPRNPEIRKHPEEGSPRWNTLVKSLEHDYFDPIVHNERNGHLVSGHLRLKVMNSMGYEQADVVVVDYDEPTHIARMLAANRTMGDDDEVGMKTFFDEIVGAGLDLGLTGFDVESLDEMDYSIPEFGDTSGSGGIDPDNPEDQQTDPPDERLLTVCSEIADPAIEVSRNEHWRLGRHHLFAGSLVRPWEWVGKLQEMMEEHGADNVRFLACGDPYSALTGKADVHLLIVQPDTFVAGHIVSNFAHAHPNETCEQLS